MVGEHWVATKKNIVLKLKLKIDARWKSIEKQCSQQAKLKITIGEDMKVKLRKQFLPAVMPWSKMKSSSI